MQKLTIETIKEVYRYQAINAKNLFLHNSKHHMVFPKYENPKLSVIMLTYNKSEYTFRCLESILAYADVPYELIIVDNASSDDTPLLLSRVKNAHVVLNDENVFFMRGNNQAAALAKTPYLLFLNNDTQISAGTFSEMLHTMQTKDKCAAVGCKLIQQDVTLQEAGCIFWANGNNREYSRGLNPLVAQASYLREADYCGGACLLVRKDLFDQLGGFSREWEPAYYEETDLCAKFRTLGYRVLFQPAAYIFHNEFTSSSPEIAKRLVDKHSDKFAAKWKDYLKQQGYGLYTGNDFLGARDRRKLPKLLIFVESIASVIDGNHLDFSLKELAEISKKYKTSIVSLSDEPKNFAVGALEKLGIETFYSEKELNEVINERYEYYDYIFSSCISGDFLEELNIFKRKFLCANWVHLDELIKVGEEIV